MNRTELFPYLFSMVQEDHCAVVVCNVDHEIMYMNPAAIEQYAKRGGEKLLGQNLLHCHNEHSREMIKKVIAWFQQDKSNNRIYTFHNEKQNKDVYMVALRDENGTLMGYYEKHEYRNRETRKSYDLNA